MWLAVVQGSTIEGEPAQTGVSGWGQRHLALTVACLVGSFCVFSGPSSAEQLPLPALLKHPMKLSYSIPEVIEESFLAHLVAGNNDVFR